MPSHEGGDAVTEETRPLAVSPARFAEQLELLAEHGFTPMTLSGLVAGVQGTGPLPERDRNGLTQRDAAGLVRPGLVGEVVARGRSSGAG